MLNVGMQEMLSILFLVHQGPPEKHHPFYSRLISNDRVTSDDHWQDVRLVCFDITHSDIKYV